MTFTKMLAILALLFSFSTHAYARNDANATKVDPKALAKARQEFVAKLGSKKTELTVKEIKEGFIFNNSSDHVTLLVLWTKDCKGCLKQIPNLNAYYLGFHGKLDIIAIEISDMTTPQLQQFAKEKKVLYTLLSGAENKPFTAAIMRKFGFGVDKNGKTIKEKLPFMVVLGYTGHTHAVIRGYPKNPQEMADFLDKIVLHYEKQHKKKSEAVAPEKPKK